MYNRNLVSVPATETKIKIRYRLRGKNVSCLNINSNTIETHTENQLITNITLDCIRQLWSRHLECTIFLFLFSFGLASWSYTETGKRFSYHRLYGQSKLAQVYFSLELANRFENITAYSLHPGAVNTEIARYHQDGFGSIVTWITENSLWIFGKTPAEGTVIQN